MALSNKGKGQNDDYVVPSYDKLLAIIAYITIIGWVISFLVYKSDKGNGEAYPLYRFHLKQSLGLMILFFLVPAVQWFFSFIPFMLWLMNLVTPLLYLGIFILWLLGLINAINGETKEVPILGQYLQHLFRDLN